MIAHFGGETKVAAVQLAHQLRQARIGARLAFARERRSMKSQLREANKYDTHYVLILGDQELADGVVAVKPMLGGKQETVSRKDLVAWLQERL
jgi:histidyl-tRNA synthetase